MYLKKTWIYGNRYEVKKYHTPRYGIPGLKRSERKRPTQEQIRKANFRNTARKLERKIIANFGEEDYHLTLTYRKEERPEAPEQIKKDLKNFLQRMKRRYKARGQELKWMAKIEIKPDHIHMIINGIPDIGKILNETWTKGFSHLSPLWKDGQQQGLAEYWLKQTDPDSKRYQKEYPFKQQYTCSRNLKDPVEKVERIGAASWRENITVPPSLQKEGYTLDKESVHTGLDAFGYAFQTYTFIRYDRNKRGAGNEKRGKTRRQGKPDKTDHTQQ